MKKIERPKSELGKFLEAQHERLGISQKDMAGRIEAEGGIMSPSMLSNIISGSRALSYTHLPIFAKVYGVEIRELIIRDERLLKLCTLCGEDAPAVFEELRLKRFSRKLDTALAIKPEDLQYLLKLSQALQHPMTLGQVIGFLKLHPSESAGKEAGSYLQYLLAVCELLENSLTFNQLTELFPQSKPTSQ